MERTNSTAFFASYLLSAFGYEFVFFVSILQIFKASGNPVLAGLLTGFTALPKCFAPFYGVITDRFRKEAVFRFTAVAVGLLILLMGLAPSLPARFAFWFLISVSAWPCSACLRSSSPAGSASVTRAVTVNSLRRGQPSLQRDQ